MLKTDGARFLRKILILLKMAKNGEKWPKMTLFQTLTKNGSKDFSDFLYGVRGGDCLTSCENHMSKKIWFSSYGPKTAKNSPYGSPDYGPEHTFWTSDPI